MTSSSGNRIGQRFGPYEITGPLGHGGFAEVYRGRNVNLPEQEVAIKVLDKEMILQDKIQQFKNEANIIMSLRHESIIRFYSYDVFASQSLGYPYIVMEYATNGSLRKIHHRGTKLPLEKIVIYVKQIAMALQYAHGNQVMHLDVKPENILVNAQWKLLLSDFGLATLATEIDRTHDIQGTLSYMAPEQVEGHPEKASDQYSLGVMIYEWICGHVPFSARSVTEFVDKLKIETPPSLSAQVPGLSPAVEAVVMRALSKTPRGRYTSVSQFADEFEKAVTQPGQAVSMTPGGPNNLVFKLPASPPAPAVAPQPVRMKVPPAPAPSPQPAVAQQQAPVAAPAPSLQPSPPSPQPAPARQQAPVVAPAPSQMPAPQAVQSSQVPPAPVKMPTPQPLPAPMPVLMPIPQAPGSAGQMPNPPGQSPFFPAMPPGSQASSGPNPHAQAQGQPWVAGMAGGAGGNQGGAPAGPASSPFLDGKPPTNQGAGTPSQQKAAPASPFLGASSPADRQFAGANMPGGHPPNFTYTTTIPDFNQLRQIPTPPSIPPYLGRPASGGAMFDAGPSTLQENVSQAFSEVFKPRQTRLRRKTSPIFYAGLLVDLLGSIFLGLWLNRLMPTTGNEMAWAGIFLSLVITVGCWWIFDRSGNLFIKGFMTLFIALTWYFIGYGFATVIAAGTKVVFLPPPDMMALLCLAGSIIIHAVMIFRMK